MDHDNPYRPSGLDDAQSLEDFGKSARAAPKRSIKWQTRLRISIALFFIAFLMTAPPPSIRGSLFVFFCIAGVISLIWTMFAFVKD